MEVIENFYNSTNIYYSLLLYCDEKPHNLIQNLEIFDFPIIHLEDMINFDYKELHHRMFCINADKLDDLLFYKNNNMKQFTVIFCCDDKSYETTIKRFKSKKPDCEENIIITKIFFI